MGSHPLLLNLWCPQCRYLSWLKSFEMALFKADLLLTLLSVAGFLESVKSPNSGPTIACKAASLSTICYAILHAAYSSCWPTFHGLTHRLPMLLSLHSAFLLSRVVSSMLYYSLLSFTVHSYHLTLVPENHLQPFSNILARARLVLHIFRLRTI